MKLLLLLLKGAKCNLCEEESGGSRCLHWCQKIISQLINLNPPKKTAKNSIYSMWEKPKSVSNLSEEKNDNGQFKSKTQVGIKGAIRKIAVVGDSHGRGIAEQLKLLFPINYKISGTIYPNDRIDHLMKLHHTWNNNDLTILQAGANNIYNNDLSTLYAGMKTLLAEVKAPLFLMSVPFRKDMPPSHKVNEDILDYNIFLNDMAYSRKNVYFIDVSLLSKKHYSLDGVQLNSIGENYNK